MVHVRGLANLLKRVLKGPNIAAAHVHDGVGAAGDGSRIDNVGHRLEETPQFLGSDSATAEKFDVGLGLQPFDRGVDGDRESSDNPGQNQPVHAPLDGGGGEPDNRPNVSISGASIVTQLVDDAAVEDVHGLSL